MGDRSGWCCHGYRVGAAWTIEPDPQRQGRREFPPAPCAEDHSFLLPSLDLCCALRWLPGSSSGEEKRGFLVP